MAIYDLHEDTIIIELPPEPMTGDEIDRVTEALGERMDCDIVADFSAVELITSSSISSLLKLRRLLRSCDRRLVLCNLNVMTKGIFETTGLVGVFDFREAPSSPTGAAQRNWVVPPDTRDTSECGEPVFQA